MAQAEVKNRGGRKYVPYEETKLYRLRHSAAHVMAQAVQELFPDVKLAIGPAIDEGWYYDFEVEKPFSPEDLQKIEERMGRIIAEDAVFRCEVKSRRESIDYYRAKDDNYKVEILEELPDDTVTFYYHSTFEDLCRGPHIPRTGIIKAYKLKAPALRFTYLRMIQKHLSRQST